MSFREKHQAFVSTLKATEDDEVRADVHNKVIIVFLYNNNVETDGLERKKHENVFN